MGVATFVTDITGGSPPFRVEAYDGSSAGPKNARLTVWIKKPEEVAPIVTRPGEGSRCSYTVTMTTDASVVMVDSCGDNEGCEVHG